MEVLRRRGREQTVVVTTHSMEEASRCDRRSKVENPWEHPENPREIHGENPENHRKTKTSVNIKEKSGHGKMENPTEIWFE